MTSDTRRSTRRIYGEHEDASRQLISSLSTCPCILREEREQRQPLAANGSPSHASSTEAPNVLTKTLFYWGTSPKA
eukprot:5202975-Pleurochrysis_carterae.AAC.3